MENNNLEYKRKDKIVGLIIVIALLLFFVGACVYYLLLPEITIKVNDVTIRQEETVPNFEVVIEYSGENSGIVLDEETGYTVKDLLEELKQGHGYSIEHEEDVSGEGSYNVNLILDDELKEKLLYKWNKKIKYSIENGTLQVLNKYGDWEQGKFKFLDGTYASTWTYLGEELYYFDEEGKRVTGEYEVNGYTYYFLENGRFDKERNKINPTKPMLALTFDDGPGRYTMQLLEEFEKHNSRATFFMVGSNVSKYPDVVKKMQEIGCEIGNHTMNHPELPGLDAQMIQSEIDGTNLEIQNVLGVNATVFRPPYGAYNETVQSLAKAPLAMWSVDPLDWDVLDAALVRDHVLNTVKDGDIVLLHDIHEATVQAALEFIPRLVEQGYQLVTVSELAKIRGVTMENGQVYYRFYK